MCSLTLNQMKKSNGAHTILCIYTFYIFSFKQKPDLPKLNIDEVHFIIIHTYELFLKRAKQVDYSMLLITKIIIIMYAMF